MMIMKNKYDNNDNHNDCKNDDSKKDINNNNYDYNYNEDNANNNNNDVYKLSLAYDQPFLGFVRFIYSSLGFIRAWSFRLEHENVLI